MHAQRYINVNKNIKYQITFGKFGKLVIATLKAVKKSGIIVKFDS